MKIVCALVLVLATTTLAQETSFLDNLIPKNFQISDYIELKKNDYQNNEVARNSGDSIEDSVENYIKGHEATFKLPILGSTVTLDARNLETNEVDVKLRFNSGSEVESRGKKHKLKKIFVPIFVFILIKAMVLIPLALGILAIKTWNALQLSFVSFVVALAMGVWQMCKKVAGDHSHPQIIAHDPWDAHHIGRAFENKEAQQMAYSAYAL